MRQTPSIVFLAFLVFSSGSMRSGLAVEQTISNPPAEEQQLTRAMRTKMDQMPRITVGQKSGDLIGSDQRVLQAAIDYVAGLGGGTVGSAPAIPRCTIRCIYARMSLYKASAATPCCEKHRASPCRWYLMATMARNRSRSKMRPDFQSAAGWQFGMTRQAVFT